jgi:hypothetical protein
MAPEAALVRAPEVSYANRVALQTPSTHRRAAPPGLNLTTSVIDSVSDEETGGNGVDSGSSGVQSTLRGRYVTNLRSSRAHSRVTDVPLPAKNNVQTAITESRLIRRKMLIRVGE